MSESEKRPSRRALKMASMTAGVTGSYLGYFLQSAFLGGEKRKEKLKTTHARAGRRMTEEFRELRGPAMKLGQLLSVQTGVLPEETLAELAELQYRAPGMHPSLVRAQFKASMGAPPETFFRSFEESPFAAASLGQVHRAVTREGRSVAVKIQYPGIREAIRSDFTWFRAFATASQLKRYMRGDLLDEIQEQITIETDYDRERRNIEGLGRSVESLGYVTVPEVFARQSSRSVLTLSVVEGEHIDKFLADRPSQKMRNLVGERLIELFYYQVLELGAFHADPHWGNYLFRSDGTIGLVDWGCVKYLSAEFVENLRAVFLFPGDRTSAEFRRLLDERYHLKNQKLDARTQKALVKFAKEFYGRVYPPEPERDEERYDFGNPEILKLYIRESQGIARAKGTLPEYIFLARAESGLYSMLHHLKARCRTSAIVRKYL